MSTNLHVRAYETFEHPVIGKQEFEFEFELYQTPTELTYTCLRSEDTLATYIEWVRKHSSTEIQPIFAEDDIWGERNPIGTESINYGEIHIEELLNWLKKYEQWKIEWYPL
jgi:hypothetical protein